jgi:hypothetical protein
MPAQLFNRRMLWVTEIIADYTQIITKIRNVNPNLKIIFTVSPVRHLNDGAPGNQLSKATLILAINQLLGIPNTYYFPAYEIMLDELRDYRFYASDMVHPSALAVDYIWEKFSRAFFSAQTIQLNSAIEKINTAKAHRPLTHNSNELQKFANSNIEKINLLIQQLPNINFQDDLEYWNKFSLIV